MALNSLDRMLDTLAHRGPDGRGVRALDDGAVLLGHRRLAIIDLSPEGAQPIGNEDGTVWLTFNGEIYNYRDLREELIRRGHRFSSRTDSEVIVHAWEEWGRDCVSRLRGIFAFGLWDGREKTLFLARDPLGVKPLYYACYAHRFTFASQPKAILADPDFPRAIDPYGLRDFLAYGYVPHARCAFAGMAKLPAGHTATLKGGALELSRYWQLDSRPDLDDPREARECLREQLSGAVRSQLVSDVPVGCFLSGGIDSSLLVAMAKPHLSELRSFTVGFEETTSDEREYARLVATHFGTRHHVSVAQERDLAPRLYELQEYFDEPFDPNGPLPFFEVARLARSRDTVVALSGDGADELFAGYLRYDDFDRPAWIPPGLPANIWQRLRHNGLLGARRSVPGDLARYFRYEGCLDTAGLRTLLEKRFLDRCGDDVEEVMRPFHRPELPAVAAAQYMDTHLYLVDHILCKVDRASMAHGVEARVPFLDPELVRLAFQIPLAMHYRHGERKSLLKQIATQFLPPQVVTSRKKGFSSPMGSWFDTRKDTWLHGWLDDGLLVQSGLLRPDWPQRLAGLQAERGGIVLRARWLLLTAELWARRWLNGENLQAARPGNPLDGAHGEASGTQPRPAEC
jgi:asparagine synthase (glutamine-hydrolysing)